MGVVLCVVCLCVVGLAAFMIAQNRGPVGENGDGGGIAPGFKDTTGSDDGPGGPSQLPPFGPTSPGGGGGSGGEMPGVGAPAAALVPPPVVVVPPDGTQAVGGYSAPVCPASFRVEVEQDQYYYDNVGRAFAKYDLGGNIARSLVELIKRLSAGQRVEILGEFLENHLDAYTSKFSGEKGVPVGVGPSGAAGFMGSTDLGQDEGARSSGFPAFGTDPSGELGGGGSVGSQGPGASLSGVRVNMEADNIPVLREASSSFDFGTAVEPPPRKLLPALSHPMDSPNLPLEPFSGTRRLPEPAASPLEPFLTSSSFSQGSVGEDFGTATLCAERGRRFRHSVGEDFGTDVTGFLPPPRKAFTKGASKGRPSSSQGLE